MRHSSRSQNETRVPNSHICLWLSGRSSLRELLCSLRLEEAPMSITIEPFDAASADEATLEGAHLAFLDLEEDFTPGQPATPLEFHRRNWQSGPAQHRRDVRCVARLHGQVVGMAHVAMWRDHPDTGLITLAVRRAHRGRGAGRSMLSWGLAVLADHGRTTFIVDIPDGSPGETAAERLGLKKALSERISQLLVTEIDWGLMEAWIADARERAAEYELLWLTPPFPEEHLSNWCLISDAMNTAPLEDLELAEPAMTPEKWRSIEANVDSRGWDLRGLAAVHRPSGDFAGMTTIFNQRYYPTVAQQDDTVVDQAHRGRGLGKWLKAAMAREFLSEFPEVTRINTGNAGSNAPMLKINTEMGFKPILQIAAWQGPIDVARSALAEYGPPTAH